MRQAQVAAQAVALPNDLHQRSEAPQRVQLGVQLDAVTRLSPVWEPIRQAWKSAKEFSALRSVEAEGLSVTVRVSSRLSRPMAQTAPGFVVLKQGRGLSRLQALGRRSWAQERLLATPWSWMLLAPVRQQAASLVASSVASQMPLSLPQQEASLVE